MFRIVRLCYLCDGWVSSGRRSAAQIQTAAVLFRPEGTVMRIRSARLPLHRASTTGAVLARADHLRPDAGPPVTGRPRP
jgi:hypothetical protein